MANSKEPASRSDQLEHLIKFIGDGGFNDYCITELDITEDVYKSHISHSVSDLFDSLNEIRDELNTDELISAEEDAFLEEMEDWDIVIE